MVDIDNFFLHMRCFQYAKSHSEEKRWVESETKVQNWKQWVKEGEEIAQADSAGNVRVGI